MKDSLMRSRIAKKPGAGNQNVVLVDQQCVVLPIKRYQCMKGTSLRVSLQFLRGIVLLSEQSFQNLWFKSIRTLEMTLIYISSSQIVRNSTP